MAMYDPQMPVPMDHTAISIGMVRGSTATFEIEGEIPTTVPYENDFPSIDKQDSEYVTIKLPKLDKRRLRFVLAVACMGILFVCLAVVIAFFFQIKREK